MINDFIYEGAPSASIGPLSTKGKNKTFYLKTTLPKVFFYVNYFTLKDIR